MDKAALVFVILFKVPSIYGQEKSFIRDYTYHASEIDSKVTCRVVTIDQIRILLIQEIGTYIQSEQILKTAEVNNKFSQGFIEKITTVTGGITKLSILEEVWNGETYWMKASITIDEKEFKENLKRLMADGQNLRTLEELKDELDKTKLELSKLREEYNINKYNSNRNIVEDYNSEINKLNSIDIVRSGNEKFQKNDFVGAISDYNRAIDIYPKAFYAHHNIAIVKTTLKDYQEALKEYDIAIEIEPNYPLAYTNRAKLKIEMGDVEGGMSDLNQCIALNPSYENAYYNRGVLKEMQKDYYGAISDYSKVIILNSNSYSAFLNRSGAKSQMGDFKGALADVSKAIEIDPSSADAYYNRGLIKSNLKDYKGAIADYTALLAINPLDAQAYNNRGYEKLIIRDYKSAITDFSEAIKINPDYGVAYHNRGLTKLQIGVKEGGCRDIVKAKELGNEGAIASFRDFCK